MPKRYWWIIVTYILCQLSGVIPAIYVKQEHLTKQAANLLSIEWIVGSFIIALIIVLLLLIPERHMNFRVKRVSTGVAVTWGIIGIFIAYAAQIITGSIDTQLFGESAQSQNTTDIVKLTMTAPYMILIVAVVGPILEEIIFRKILFGVLYRKLNFWWAALISSLIFAIAHMDHHLIIYTSVGLVFCYLYKKTNRIITSMISHACMNGSVVLMQMIFSDQLQKTINQSQHLHFIKGLF